MKINSQTPHSGSTSPPPSPAPEFAHPPTPSLTSSQCATETLRTSSSFSPSTRCSLWSDDYTLRTFGSCASRTSPSASPTHRFPSVESFLLLPFFMVFVRELLTVPISPCFLPHKAFLFFWTDCFWLSGTVAGRIWVCRKHQACWSCSNSNIWHNHRSISWRCSLVFPAGCYIRGRVPEFLGGFKQNCEDIAVAVL